MIVKWRKPPWAAVIAVTLALCAILFFLLRAPPQPDLAMATARIGDVEQTVLATGKLRPKELVSVGAQVSGQVQRLYVVLGQRVRAGDPIADIDPRQQQFALRSAEAAVDALRAQQATRRAALVQAELAYQRQQTMLAQDATARADFEAARSALESARAEIRALTAQLVQARTQIDTARINLGYTRIVAPMDGVVVAVVTKQGQTVNSFQTAPTIVMLAKLDVMTVRAEISEADVDKVKPGQTVWFTTLGAPDRRLYARIERVEPAPESIASDPGGAQSASQGSASTPTAIYYQALFDVPNADRRLRPSMTAQVSVLLARAQRAVIIPATALQRRDADGRATVRMLDARGQPVERKIRIGISDNSNVVVLAGLRPGEKIVIAEAAPAAASSSAEGMSLGF
ncbi:efflux RND transporter periplasmic adaptor subunit [Sphingomonas koreensis]